MNPEKIERLVLSIAVNQFTVPLPTGKEVIRAVNERDHLLSENAKLLQVLGWILDAADAAYVEDSDNVRIHEIFNIVAKATGITRRMPDEYQRFDETSSDE